MKKLIIPFLLVALIPVSGFAQEYKTVDVSGKRGGRIVLSVPGNPETFNPHLKTSSETTSILHSVFRGLVDYNYTTNKMEPELAKSYTVSDDAKLYTFKIRQGLKWSDGTPFTTDDVIFSWNALVDKNTTANIKEAFQQTDGSFPEIKKLDEETVQFVLKDANVLFTNALGDFMVLARHKLEKRFKEGKFNQTYALNEPIENIVSMGPFRIKKFVSDQVMIMERNPHFFKKDKAGVQLPYLDRHIRLIVPDFEASFVKFQNGEIDMMEVKPDKYDILKRKEKEINATIHDLGPSYNMNWYMFNLNHRKNAKGVPYVDPDKHKIFSDKRFRQAMSYATDRNGITKVAYQNRATPHDTIVSPISAFHTKERRTYSFDRDKAKKLLDEIGLVDKDGDGYRDLPNGKPFSFTIKTNTENKIRINVGNLLKEDFKAVGVKAKLQPVPFNTLITSLTANYDFEVLILGWGSSVPPDPLESRNIYFSHANMHAWNPSQKTPHTPWEKEMDDIIRGMMKTPKQEDRVQQYKRFLEIWQDEMPQVIHSVNNMYAGVSNKFGNVKPSVLRPYFEWNIEELYDKTIAQ